MSGGLLIQTAVGREGGLGGWRIASGEPEKRCPRRLGVGSGAFGGLPQMNHGGGHQAQARVVHLFIS